MPAEADSPLELAYSAPAAIWAEALPVGNGRLGAMVHGTCPVERVNLNEDTFWSGPGDTAVPQVPDELLARARAQVRAGQHAAAGRTLMATQGADAEAFQPIGDLHLEFIGSIGVPRTYRRSLDLRDGVARVDRGEDSAEGEDRADGKNGADGRNGGRGGHGRPGGRPGLVRQQVIATARHQVIAVRLETDDPRGLGVNVRFSTPQRRAEIRPQGRGALALLLAAPRHVLPWPHQEDIRHEDDELPSIRAAALLLVDAEGAGAEVGSDGGTAVTVRGAAAVTVYVAIRTGFAGWRAGPGKDAEQCLAEAVRDVEEALSTGWAGVLAAHLADHRALMDRVTLELTGGEPVPALPVDQRLSLRAGGARDEHLCVLAFALGRYLLAASSRPGTQAATLQGIWNSEVTPPWNCEYTVNINAEMNYWPAETTALPECHEPLLRLVRDLAEAGRPAAHGIYGARGWTCHHNTDLWRITVPVGGGLGDPMWAQWPMGGAWLATHLAERWRFGRDPEFLAAVALPVCLDAARFVLDLLVDDGGGRLVTSPSTSPENEFLTGEGPASVVEGSAMDLTLARELFEFVLEGGRELAAAGRPLTGRDAAALAEVGAALPRLAPLRIGADGRLLEWSAELREADPHHRHVSHLVGLYPGRTVAVDPELRAAARRSLEGRGDAGTGWSVAWKTGLWARLGDGAAAHRLLGEYLRPVAPAPEGPGDPGDTDRPDGPGGTPGADGPGGPDSPPGADGTDRADSPDDPDGPRDTNGPNGPGSADGPDDVGGTGSPLGADGPGGPRDTNGSGSADGPDSLPGADGTDSPDDPGNANGPLGTDGLGYADGPDSTLGPGGTPGAGSPGSTPGVPGPASPAGGVYRSMLCAHPPFQIDGNFGVTAAIAEMLLQSHEEHGGVPLLRLLPALPPQWPNGRVTGLRGRGAVSVAELAWSGGALDRATVEALADTRIEVRWTDRDGRERARALRLSAGERATLG